MKILACLSALLWFFSPFAAVWLFPILAPEIDRRKGYAAGMITSLCYFLLRFAIPLEFQLISVIAIVPLGFSLAIGFVLFRVGHFVECVLATIFSIAVPVGVFYLISFLILILFNNSL